MRPRHAVLLTPLGWADPMVLLYSKQIASVTSLESALPSHSEVTENTATLSPVEFALTRLSPATPLECAVPKNTGGGGLSFPFWNSPLRTGHRHLRSFFSSTYALPILQLLSFQTHACDGGYPFWLCASLPRSPSSLSPIPIPFLFTFLRTLLHFFALVKNSTLLFSISSALFAKNSRGWGYPHLSLQGAR
jgi:hypothetical protein